MFSKYIHLDKLDQKIIQLPCIKKLIIDDQNNYFKISSTLCLKDLKQNSTIINVI